MQRNKRNDRRFSNLSRHALIEPLEGRTFFDLVPSIAGVLPSELVATVKNNSQVTVDLTNTGGSSVSGAFTVALFASTSPVLGAAVDTPVGSITESRAFGVGIVRDVKFKLTDFPDVANGSYYLLAEVTGPLAGTTDNVAVSNTTIGVADPFVDLSDTVSIVGSANSEVLPGKRVGFTLEVFNNGNIPVSGLLTTDVGLTADAGATVIPFPVTAPHIRILAGGHQLIHVTETVPVGFVPGSYDWDVTVDPADTFNESDTTNNNALSTTPLTVLDPYPDMLGTFTGPDHITHGPSKGATVTIALDFTSESNTTGVLVATGTLFTGASTSTFSLTGTISTRGVFNAFGSSTTSVFTATYKGKLVKNTLSGTVVNTDGNSGKFTLVG